MNREMFYILVYYVVISEKEADYQLHIPHKIGHK